MTGERSLPGEGREGVEQRRQPNASRSDGRVTRGLQALVWLGLCGLSLALWQAEKRWGARVDGYFDRFGIAARRPADADAIRREGAADLRADLLALSVLQDRRPNELEPVRWLLSEAIARRPGRAYHLFLLGAAERAIAADRNVEAWFGAMRLAASRAPGLGDLRAGLATALLESWSSLPPAVAGQGPAWVREAFADPAYIARELVRASSLLGRERALSLVPDNTPCLESAQRTLASSGDAAGAEAVALRARRIASQSPS